LDLQAEVDDDEDEDDEEDEEEAGLYLTSLDEQRSCEYY